VRERRAAVPRWSPTAVSTPGKKYSQQPNHRFYLPAHLIRLLVYQEPGSRSNLNVTAGAFRIQGYF